MATIVPVTSEPVEAEAAAEERFQQLLELARKHRPKDDLTLVERAYQTCLTFHRGQKRASGEPYVMHPVEVASILAEWRMDSTALAAGLLHDAVEDTPITTKEITAEFGSQVAHIVEGVTKIDKIQFANSQDRQAENVRKMLLAMVTDVRVVLIKFADRLHNMRTLEHLPPHKQLAIARETIDIYAPLANRLGMGKLRGELEDLAFRYVDPIAYEQTRLAVEERRGEGEVFLQGVEKMLQAKMREYGLQGRMEWRIKRLYSVYHNMVEKRIAVAQLFDLLAIRVIVATEQDCYGVFGLVHQLWKPVPGRIKDWIAMPRANMYQSLHTTVMGEGGHQFEIQIRTEEMHRVAEDGIAAHWKYKAGKATVSATAEIDDKRLDWIRQLKEWQRDMTDPGDFLSTLKIDLYPEEVYTFTPMGRVVILPQDASPVDFAYAVHTKVGDNCTGARVNGRIVPLRTKLKNGDVVEVITQAGHTPSRDWLSFTKSSKARNKIKHWLNEHQRERAVEIGRKLLDREARKFKVGLNKISDADYTRTAEEYGMTSQNEIVAGIGYGKFSARQVLNKLAPGSTARAGEVDAETAAPSFTQTAADAVKRVFFGKGSDSLQVEGSSDLLVYRARCCNPIRGEEIVGYVTRGKGVAVHSRSCPNVQNLMYESDRKIAVDWSKSDTGPTGKSNTYPVKLTIFCDDRAGMLKEMTAAISDDGTNIRGVDYKGGKGEHAEAEVDFVIEAEDMRHLNRLVAGLRKVGGVREVQRMQRL